MSKKLFFLPLVVFFALLLASSVGAQENSPVSAAISSATGDFTVGDPITLELVVNHPAESHLIIPELAEEWGEFTVYSQSAPESITNPDGSKTTTQLLDVRLFAPGDYQTPQLPLTLATADGQLIETVVQPASVTIGSVLIEGDEALRDIKPQAELPYVFLLPWLVAAAVVIAAAVIIVWILRKRRTAGSTVESDPRLPYEVALDRLDRIERLELPNEGRFKEHYTMVSDCVRIYVERAFDVPVMERTTTEIQQSIKTTTIAPPISRQFLSLLDESDLVKFSKFTPDVESARRALLQGRHIVMETKPKDESESVSGSTGAPVNRMDDVIEPTVSNNGNIRHTEVQA